MKQIRIFFYNKHKPWCPMSLGPLSNKDFGLYGPREVFITSVDKQAGRWSICAKRNECLCIGHPTGITKLYWMREIERNDLRWYVIETPIDRAKLP